MLRSQTPPLGTWICWHGSVGNVPLIRGSLRCEMNGNGFPFVRLDGIIASPTALRFERPHDIEGSAPTFRWKIRGLVIPLGDSVGGFQKILVLNAEVIDVTPLN